MDSKQLLTCWLISLVALGCSTTSDSDEFTIGAADGFGLVPGELQQIAGYISSTGAMAEVGTASFRDYFTGRATSVGSLRVTVVLDNRQIREVVLLQRELVKYVTTSGTIRYRLDHSRLRCLSGSGRGSSARESAFRCDRPGIVLTVDVNGVAKMSLSNDASIAPGAVEPVSGTYYYGIGSTVSNECPGCAPEGAWSVVHNAELSGDEFVGDLLTDAEIVSFRTRMRSGHVETSTTENFASGSSRIRVLRTPAIVDSEPAAYYVRFHTDYEIRRGRPAFDGSVEYFGRAVPPPVCGYNDVLSNAGRAVYNLTELRLLVHASATGSATAEFVSQDWICSIQHQQDGVVPDCSSCYPFTPGVRNYVSPIGGPRQSIRLSNQR